jgi:hypothetical protein
LRNSIAVATRYAALRKQFGKEDNEEISILNYPTTQMRIIPALAENFALRLGCFDAQVFFFNPYLSLIYQIRKMIK